MRKRLSSNRWRQYSTLRMLFPHITAAPHLFGERVEAFANEVRELLKARSPKGLFWDWPGDTEVILALKHG